MRIEPIGVIRTPYRNLADMPIQPRGGRGVRGEVIVDEAYAEGLADLDGFSHLYLIYHFHKARRTELTVLPFMDSSARGVFATRSPLRPNHLGISVVELVAVQEARLVIEGVDILDKTPLLDIKPYIDAFDRVERSRSGWMGADGDEVEKRRSDERFV